MLRLIILGILSCALFSTTFVFNEIMHVSGGHWVWSASIRYFFMILFLVILLFIQGGVKRLKSLFQLFIEHYWFWTISGTIGFGFFYALICFAADTSPGWVIAATWQFTIVAALFILLLFGKRFPKKVWFFSLIIFIGVCLLNSTNIDNFDFGALLLGGIPVIIASFCYPLGNQLVWEAQNGNHTLVPKITSHLMANAFNRVMLLSIGSLPLWILLILTIRPTAPSNSQIIDSAFVALFSGVLGTAIFLYARNLAKDANQIAAVDATQASEVVFTIIGSALYFGDVSLNGLSLIGLALITCGLILFAKYQTT